VARKNFILITKIFFSFGFFARGGERKAWEERQCSYRIARHMNQTNACLILLQLIHLPNISDRKGEGTLSGTRGEGERERGRTSVVLIIIIELRDI
jgi:hypothetical protein